jgi:hypothetical protein
MFKIAIHMDVSVPRSTWMCESGLRAILSADRERASPAFSRIWPASTLGILVQYAG